MTDQSRGIGHPFDRAWILDGGKKERAWCAGGGRWGWGLTRGRAEFCFGSFVKVVAEGLGACSDDNCRRKGKEAKDGGDHQSLLKKIQKQIGYVHGAE